MASRKPAGKFKPGANVDFTPIIPKFLQGRMESTPKRRNHDDSDDEENRPAILEMPEGKDRPELEDEAPTIVADDDIMALLAKQEVVVGEGKLERKKTETAKPDGPKDEEEVSFGAKSRAKKTAPVEKPATDSDSKADANDKKRPSASDPEQNLPKKREAKKKMLSFDDEEDI